MARLIWLAILAAILQALSGCAMVQTALDRKQISSTEQLGVQVDAAPSVTIIVPNGNVKLHVGEAGRVAAVATRRGYGASDAEARAAHDNLEVGFTQRGPEVTLEARRVAQLPDGQGDEATLDVAVPAGSAVTIRVANGEIVATSAGADLSADAQNGTITLYVPRGDSFTFAGSVANGSFMSAFPEVGSKSGNDVKVGGTVGDAPGYSVEATCANGVIALNRAE
jgi:hypothetical protein